MILVDTSVWIDHLHRAEPAVVDNLGRFAVVQHPLIIGELALGTLRDRELVLDLLQNLPTMPTATHADVMYLVDRKHLYGRGLSLVDAHLLASVLLNPGTTIWTRDKRLLAAARSLGVAHSE
ncbi:MAG: type II toxin-antitoxin system VapC family toxin [Microbacteriaceae bacterium]|nr:type II toxin-antitoxin system VapC family toxin [Microbacteriaceae bacterium]